MTQPAWTSPGEAQALVRVEGLEKRYGATLALGGVTFDVRHGETLGLLGANGAGKSTLIKILSGMQRPTAGSIFVEGTLQAITSPVGARDCGIVTVHQNIDDGVVFGMTVAENLLLDTFPRPGSPFATQASLRRRARAMLDELQYDIPLDTLVEDLSASRRQEVSIARALIKKPKLLILDEPTSTLSAREADRLFESVRAMRARGISILYVSHKMSEIRALCERAVVLRNGRVVSTHEAPLDTRAIANAILGELVLSGTHESRAGRDIVLAGQGVQVRADSKPFDVAFRRGEVVGITGLVGAGKTELLEQFFGARRIVAGRLELEGRPFAPAAPVDALENGIAMVPEERAVQSIFPTEDLAHHCSIPDLGRFSTAGLMSRSRETAFATQVIADFAVKCPGAAAPIEALSGGNQQKLLVGRWLAGDYKLIILDEPFRGIDIGARGIISDALRRRSEHCAVIVSSSDPEEVVDVADRVLVMVEGTIVLDVRASDLTAEQLADIMSGASATPASAGQRVSGERA